MDITDNHPDSAEESSAPVEARRVDDSRRLLALPRYSGHRMMRFESAVYGFMHRFAPDYRGGFWQFELSNGGFYMALDRGSFRFCVPTNGYEGRLSADAAGITVCLFACGHLSFYDTRDDLYGERFHQLREFAIQHAEASQTFSAID
jgi:Antirestriction protein